MYTQRPFTSQVISKIYFLTFASYIEKLPETTIKNLVKEDREAHFDLVPFASKEAQITFRQVKTYKSKYYS